MGKKCLFVFVLCIFVRGSLSQTSCDFEVQFVSTQMGNFNNRGYKPFNVGRIYDELNSLRAGILATYLLCFNKSLIDPDSLYPQDISECEMGLYNVSLLQTRYSGNFAKIKAQLDSVAKIVFSTQNDCRPVLYYKGWSNLTDDCSSAFNVLDGTIEKYDQNVVLEGNGLSFINDMILQTEKIRKLCGFNIMVKAKAWSQDTCIAADGDWLYPLTDQIDTYISKKMWINATQSVYILYQTLYRVKDICRVNLLVD